MNEILYHSEVIKKKPFSGIVIMPYSSDEYRGGENQSLTLSMV
jgi:hypothetical protein